jgi:phospholipid transport system substrate-binding protein
MMIRRSFLKAVLALGVTARFIGPVRADDGDGARKFIQDLAQTAIATVANKQLSDQQRRDRFRQLFVSTFDLPEISRFVLSRYWRTATPEQQQQFVKLFEETMVLIWSQRFKDYSGESLAIQGAGPDRENGWQVDSQVIRPQGPPVPVQWRVKQLPNGGYRIVDIVAEGTSMALTYRQDYAGAMQQNGRQMDALLNSMRGKIEQLKAGP